MEESSGNQETLPSPRDPSNDTPSASDDGRSKPGSLDLSQVTPFRQPPSREPWSGSITSPSITSDHILGFPSAASDISGDVVFPIRSVVSVDPRASRAPPEDAHQPTAEVLQDHFRRSRHNTLQEVHTQKRTESSPTSPQTRTPFGREAGPLSSIQADAARHGSIAPIDFDISPSDGGTDKASNATPSGGAVHDSTSQMSEGQSSLDIPHVATRFNYIETEDGYSVITGREGDLQQCEDEPIHTPGAVQGFGAMVALQEESDGCFIVRYVSENSDRLLGYTPKQLFRQSNFLNILTDEQQDNLLDHIDFIRDEDADPIVNGPELLSISIRHPKTRRSVKLWSAIHINAAHPDLIICEFELDDDTVYPLRPQDESAAETPTDTLDSNPTREEIEESTEILSKPLRILRSARKRRGEQGAMQVFDIMSQVQEQLASASTLDLFLKVLVGIVKELTGFHRIMIYQFDASFNGKVVTELVDTSQTKDLYKGLHFPASDIPRQARDLYRLNKVRLLYDRDLETARIVCRTKEDLEIPLDMTHSYLRAMSPIHLKYLGNMGVRSSMSISINAFNELWGLVACHSYGNFGMRVSFPIRKMCRLVGETASRNIERLSYASRLQARKLINTAPTDKNPSGYIIASSDDLLRLFDADFGLLSIKDETKILGTMQQSQEALALLEYLKMRRLTSVTATQDVKMDFPDLRYPPGFQVISGLLYVPLSVGGNDFIVFFRKGQIREVKWAGNPYEKFVRQGTAAYLEPRSSFKAWHELVLGKCREWHEEQIETAAVLCLVYGKFIEIWRQKEAALQNSKLTKILLANSAHEVRTPLNAIINYLEIALEGSLDDETRDNLTRSHSASKSLIYVINDLLDLTKAEEGQNLIKDEVFDLEACIKEATEPFQADAQRKGISYEIVNHPGLPRLVHGDSRRVRQAISNVTANAVTHTDSGWVKVEVLVIDVKDTQVTVDFVIADSGKGMTADQVDALFQDLEQVGTADVDSSGMPIFTDQDDTRALGLGLAVVGRIVRNMDGQLRLKSEPGKGSRFVIQLPFIVPTESSSPEGQESLGMSGTSTERGSPLGPPTVVAAQSPEGEITLVDRGSGPVIRQTIREGSIASGSRRSGSHGSQDSKKSDADRLIDAIQTPLSINKDKDTDYFGSRAHVRGRSAISVSASPPNASSSTSSVLADQDQKQVAAPQVELGTAEVKDSRTPIRPVKVPDDYQQMPPPSMAMNPSMLAEISSGNPGDPGLKRIGAGASGNDGAHLRVLVAEDDPINFKIVQKRLERLGHKVHHAANGDDCATAYKEKPMAFDLVLMDMQMPIVDGLTSTKLIRAAEKSPDHGGHSTIAATNGRIPIFAVSASLVEKERQTYIDAGFDGWILKPIDFKRLNTLLAGIHDIRERNKCLYSPGNWERGGWFYSRAQILGHE